MGPGGPGLSSTIPQGGATAMAALLGPRRDALCSKPEKSKRLYQHLRHTIHLRSQPKFRLPLDEASYPGGGCLQCRGADPAHRVPRSKHHVLGAV